LRDPEKESKLVQFSVWLLRKGNREQTIARKMKYLRVLNGNLEEMTQQLLKNSWCDKSKECAINAIAQYAEYLNVPYSRPVFRGDGNKKMYVPNPEMVKQFVYRVRSPHTKAMIMLAIETGGSAGEIFNLKWKDTNLAKLFSSAMSAAKLLTTKKSKPQSGTGNGSGFAQVRRILSRLLAS